MLSISKRLFARLFGTSLLLWLLPLSATAAEWPVNMTEGVTAMSREIFGLHMQMFWWCVGIGLVVFGVMFYTMIVHRKSRGATASNFHESTALEIVWTVIPFVILIAMAIPATSTLKKIYDTEDADLDVLITGYQWKWKYEYLGEDVSFFSNMATPQSQIRNEQPKTENYLLEVDEPLVIPAGKKVRFLVTAADVIHSWWVPALAVKRDAIPGYVHEAWTFVDEPGVYRGQCAELCGKDHAFMPIEVHVVEPELYANWLTEKREEAAKVKALTEKTFEFDELYSRGKDVYESRCAACHGMAGEGGVGTAIRGSAIAMGPMDQHTDVVVNGVPGTAMQAFGDQLSEVDLAAVITYQRNAFGNNMGDSLQPIDILNFKQGQ